MKLKKSVINPLTICAAAVMVAKLMIPGLSAKARGLSDDELYKRAYDAVVMAKTNGTQQDINAARSAITSLKYTGAQWAIGEFSKQVDGPQQKLFEEFMHYIFNEDNSRKAKISIDDINKAVKLVRDFDTYYGNKPYTPSWSSAMDEYVQCYINEGEALLKKLQASKTKEDKDLLVTLVNDIKRIENNPSVDNWTKSVEKSLADVNIMVDVAPGFTVDTFIMENNISTIGIVADSAQVDKEASSKITSEMIDGKIAVKAYEKGTYNVILTNCDGITSTITVDVAEDGKISLKAVNKYLEYVENNKETLGIKATKVVSVVDRKGLGSNGVNPSLIKVGEKDVLCIKANAVGVYNITVSDDEYNNAVVKVTVKDNGTISVVVNP